MIKKLTCQVLALSEVSSCDARNYREGGRKRDGR
jgi:hypothetical protein